MFLADSQQVAPDTFDYWKAKNRHLTVWVYKVTG